MKKDIAQQTIEETYHAFLQKKQSSIQRPQKVRKISKKTQKGISRAYGIYSNSGSFSDMELKTFQMNLVKAAQKRKIQLENELESNGVDICPTLEGAPLSFQTSFDMVLTKTSLATQVAHGRTFGRALTKCPSCRTGQLHLEIREGRYICHQQPFISASSPSNCGFVFEIPEINHINWVQHC